VFLFIVYCIYVLIYLINKISYLDKIIKGTDEITFGNLNYTIEEKGKGNLSRLSHNINNLEVGIKKSMEEQMKSERLKSELITNVSHDLKTPLTSIINYVNLLKQDNLSKEEIDGYVAVLDRNTEGSGLGLAIAKSIAELQGGSLNIEIDGDLFKAAVNFNKII